MIKNSIVKYLSDTYKPRALLIYGSFVRGDFDESSDFDCMVIVDEKNTKHDSSVINGVRLDCYIFTVNEVLSEDPDLFVTVYDSEILIDDGTGQTLKERVRDYVHEHEITDDSEKEFIAAWIRKTMTRMKKGDDEGNYRAIALLWESLTDYYLLRNMFFFGSKQAIQYLKQNDLPGYELFHRAISQKTNEAIEAWAMHVIEYR